jgi:hypothetical protein
LFTAHGEADSMLRPDIAQPNEAAFTLYLEPPVDLLALNVGAVDGQKQTFGNLIRSIPEDFEMNLAAVDLVRESIHPILIHERPVL